ncbi:MAG: hypothetical protein QXD62_02385 [Candidatus Woesearchaeota archaeon]
MDESKIEITFEKLMDLYRREKNNPNLEELPSDFYQRVLEYLKLKESEIKTSSSESELFLDENEIKEQRQYSNAKKIISKIYELRESKIVEMAKNKALSKNIIINTTNMLDYEKQLFNYLLGVFSLFRENILERVLSLKEPILSLQLDINYNEKQEIKLKRKVKVQFLTPIPEFIDAEGKKYGPYLENEIDILPEDIAEILIKKKKCIPFDQK